jgi:hypothetical protein
MDGRIRSAILFDKGLCMSIFTRPRGFLPGTNSSGISSLASGIHKDIRYFLTP